MTNPQKTGQLIRSLRLAHQWTQRQLAQQLHITDRTVSKWECGGGCPDLALLPPLAQVLGVSLDALLEGELSEQGKQGGTMKKLQFYVCPTCGSLVTATGNAQPCCCGKPLTALVPQPADPSHTLQIEPIETEWYLTAAHEMTRAHYIAFVALVCDDTVVVRQRYPEWALETRLPRLAGSKLLWYCTEHGLFEQKL